MRMPEGTVAQPLGEPRAGYYDRFLLKEQAVNG